MKREELLLTSLLEQIQELEDVVHRAHNAGTANIRLNRLGILLAGMLHMFENGNERVISDAVAKLVLNQINLNCNSTSRDAIRDLIDEFDQIKLN